MLTDRIIGALTFRKEVYAEVERDVTFTQTAWMLILITTFLSRFGNSAAVARTTDGGFIDWLVGTFVGTIFGVIGFAIGAYVIVLVAKSLFNADVDFEEIVRTLGLASIWQAFGVLSVIGLGFFTFLAGLAAIAAWVIALKEALDLEWFQTIITIVIFVIVMMFVYFIAGAIVSIFGIAAAAVGGFF
jgi:hypothetical protein